MATDRGRVGQVLDLIPFGLRCRIGLAIAWACGAFALVVRPSVTTAEVARETVEVRADIRRQLADHKRRRRTAKR